MPLSFDPSEIFRYVLSTDRIKSIEDKPTLLFHFPTCKQVRTIANKFDEANKVKSVDESILMRLEAIKLILCGWENFKDREGKAIEYNADALEDILSESDLTELNARLIREMSTSEIEKKKTRILHALNFGQFCKKCTNQCVKPPTPDKPYELECVVCNGKRADCPSCKGMRVFKIIGCPYKEIDKEIVEAMKHVKLADRHLPLTGGTYDQTQCFIDYLDWCNTETRRWKAEYGIT